MNLSYSHLLAFYGITTLVYHIGFISDALQNEEGAMSILQKIITNSIKLAIFITWVLSFFIIVPFKQIFTARLFNSKFFFLLQFISAFSGLYIKEYDLENNVDNNGLHYYKYLLNFETIIFVTILSLISAFMKNIYETIGPIYEDIFIKLIDQGKTYKDNYVLIFTYFKKYTLTCFIPSIAFMILFYQISNKIYMIKNTNIKFSLRFRILPLFYIVSVVSFFNTIVIPLPPTKANSLFFKYVVTPNSRLLEMPEKLSLIHI